MNYCELIWSNKTPSQRYSVIFLLSKISPAPVVTLILSEVIRHRLDVIASGPTVPDSTSFDDAVLVIVKYGLKTEIRSGVTAFIERGEGREESETIKNGEPCFLKSKPVNKSAIPSFP